MSFTWFSQNGALSAVVALSELEATCLMIAAGTGLLGPQAQKYADLGRLLADIMNGGTLYVILDGKEWPDMGGKRLLAEAPDDLRARLRALLEPALARYGAVFLESAVTLVP